MTLAVIAVAALRWPLIWDVVGREYDPTTFMLLPLPVALLALRPSQRPI